MESSEKQDSGESDLAECFSASFNVTNHPNDTNKPHPRFAQYKIKSSSISQDVRRRKLLQHQRARRDDFMNLSRCLAEGDIDEGEDEEDENEEEDMETSEEVRPRKLRKSYKNQLMFSEWLVETPEDLAEKWLLVLCPEGRRNLVVAGRGETKAFSKSGMMVKKFPSNLPGGKRQGKRNSFTILDCIYSETSGTFYILDMMCWDRFQYYDCDTEFRFSWVRQKVLEDQDLGTKSKLNPYSFQTLPFYQSTRESIHQVLNSPLPLSDPLDGLLIYHKEVHYMPGRTPLVGWLKAYMVPELMDIQVADMLMQQMPEVYGGMKIFLKKTYDRVSEPKKAEKSKEEEQEME